MKSAPIGEHEADRLAALYRYRILDTQAEQEFDEITGLAAQICGVPIALVSLVDIHRQWFKSRVGIEVEQTVRSISFCAHAIEQGADVFEVSDARADARFAGNPMVTERYCEPPRVRAKPLAAGALS